MFELGEDATQAIHHDVGDFNCTDAGVDRLFTFGELSREAAAAVLVRAQRPSNRLII